MSRIRSKYQEYLPPQEVDCPCDQSVYMQSYNNILTKLGIFLNVEMSPKTSLTHVYFLQTSPTQRLRRPKQTKI